MTRQKTIESKLYDMTTYVLSGLNTQADPQNWIEATKIALEIMKIEQLEEIAENILIVQNELWNIRTNME